MRLSDGNLHGRTVIGADGLAIGEIAGLFLDSGTWGVESLQVSLRKDVADRVDADRSIFRAGTLEIPIRLVQSVGAGAAYNSGEDDDGNEMKVVRMPGGAKVLVLGQGSGMMLVTTEHEYDQLVESQEPDVTD